MSPAVAVAAGVAILCVVMVLTWVPPDRLAFVVVGVLVLVITWNGLRAVGGAFSDLLLVVAFIAVIAHAVFDHERVLIPAWLLATAVGFVAAALLVAMFPPNLAIENRTQLQFNQAFLSAGVPITALGGSRSNLVALLKWEIALVGIPVLIAVVARTPWRVNRLLDVWTLSATINAFVGILDYSGFHALAAGPLYGTRSAGLTLQPNYLALTCVLAMPTALRLVGRSRRATYAGVIATLILIGGDYVSGSRDGNVSAALCLVLCFVLLPRLRPMLRYLIPPAAVAFVALLALTHLGRQILHQMRLGGGIQSATGSDNERAFVKHIADAQISERPFIGVGFAVDNDAQNIYLQILAAGGIVAACAFLAFIGGLARCVRRALHGPVREEALVCGLCIVVWLINGYYNSQVADKYLYVLPGILVACARVTARVRRDAAPVVAIEDLGPVSAVGSLAAGTPVAASVDAAPAAV